MSVCEIGFNKYTFAFSQKETFNGKAFFEKYKCAHFLTDLKNITKILCQGQELRECWNSLKPGDQLIVEGMFLKPGFRLKLLSPRFLRPMSGYTVCEGNNEHTFAFSEKKSFDGKAFIERYICAEFLADQKNLTKILSQGQELRKRLNSVLCGDQITIEGMFLESGVPLVIKKSVLEDESDVGDHEFTFQRLSGLAAVMASKQPFLVRITEAEELGLGWDKDELSQRLYLAAAPGAELFTDYFDVLPFVCALRKYHLNKISEEQLLEIAMMPCSNGEPAGKKLLNQDHPAELLVKELEEKFVGSWIFKIEVVLALVPRPYITYIKAL